MRAVIAVGAATLVSLALGKDLLVRVEVRSDADLKEAAMLGGEFLERFDGWFLVRVAEARLPELAGPWSCTVLDQAPDAARLVYALVEPGPTRRRLEDHGTFLTEDRQGALLSTTESGIKAMNLLAVELCGVSSRPSLPPLTSMRQPRACPNLSDSLIWLLMSRASPDSAEAVLRRLIAFRTRYAYSESGWSAARWFQDRLAAYGCDTAYLDTFQSTLGPNVIGVKRGRANPNLIYVVCGHLDNTSETPYDYAPGSDDNASGAGLVLEAARMVADLDFDCTVWFIGFGAEEQGLVGSDSFVRRCRERGDTIVLAINHDMNSYGTAGRDSIQVVGKRTNPPCSTWVDFYLAQADTFTELKCRREIVEQQPSSDHHSFWKYGYPAIRDRYLDRNPVYHTTGDTIGPFEYYDCGTNNLPMYTEVIKATVATLAKLAGARPRVGLDAGPAQRGSGPALAARPSHTRGSVRFSLPPGDTRATTLCILEASGRLVTTLPFAAWTEWDGAAPGRARVPPGVYYARLPGHPQAGVARVVIMR